MSEEKKNSTAMPPMRGPGGHGPGGPGRAHGPGGKPKDTKKTVGRIFKYIERDVPKLVIVFFCVLLNTGCTLAGSYLLRPIINNLKTNAEEIAAATGSVAEGILKAGTEALLTGLLVMLCVYLVGVVCSYLQSRIMVSISQRALCDMRNELFGKIQKLPIRFFDTNNHGELMSRFTNDLDAVGEMLNNTIPQMISAVITLVGTMALMLFTSPVLSLITLVAVPFLSLVGGQIAKRSRRFYSEQQAAIGAVNGYVEEAVTGQKVIKVFCHEDTTMEEFSVLNDDLKKKQIRASFVGGIMGPVMGNLSQISYALTALVGGVLCVTNNFDIGGLTIFVNYSKQFARPINEVSMQMHTVFSALAGAERVFKIMDEEPEAEDTKTAVSPEEIHGDVVLSHVTFGYNPDKTILKDISLYAKPGQKIAFVGSTGAGKTTITNLLNRFYDIQEGEITIDGVNICDIRRDTLRQNIAMVLQDTHLFTGTVRENIRYGRLDATDEEVEAAAKVASAHSFIMRLENGYDTMLEGDGANLSQGQRQLLNIARAAISKAPILVLDEATSSVDTRTERHIEHGMDRLMKNRTTFVIAHRLSTVRNADAIMVLEQGEIIERGTHDELLALGGRYYELYTGLKELD
ncbi:MAG: ABC transporter ATP-binding protein [Lachnospiraceae bacterium]